MHSRKDICAIFFTALICACAFVACSVKNLPTEPRPDSASTGSDLARADLGAVLDNAPGDSRPAAPDRAFEIAPNDSTPTGEVLSDLGAAEQRDLGVANQGGSGGADGAGADGSAAGRDSSGVAFEAGSVAGDIGGGGSDGGSGDRLLPDGVPADQPQQPDARLPGRDAAADSAPDDTGYSDAGGDAACPTSSPTFSLVEGFEDLPTGSLGSGTSWVRYSMSRTSAVAAAWAHTGKNALEVASFTTSTEIDYVPLKIPGPVHQLVLEFWFAPDGYYVYKDFATFGVGRTTSKYDFTPLFSLQVSDHDMTAQDAIWGPQKVWSEVDYSTSITGSAVYNYVRLEFDLCNQSVAVYAGSGSDAPLRASIPLPAGFDFNAFYVSGGLNPTHLDDIVVYTPGTTVDRTALGPRGPAVLSTFASPGSSCTALAWDGSSLWFLDNIGRLYQLSPSGTVLKTIDQPEVTDGSDLAWDGSALWALDVGYSTGEIVKLDASGRAGARIGPVSTWAWSGLAWDGQFFWVGDYNSGTIHKYDTTGRQILNWQAASFDHPRGMAAGPAGLWYAAGDQLYYQSFVGDVLQIISLADLGLASGGCCLEWDGSHLWYSAGFTVSQIALTGP